MSESLQVMSPAPAALQQTQPQSLLERAISSGASIEVMRGLMDLQERWQAQQAKAAFDAAMADLRLNLPVITKNQKVDFTSSRGRTHYKYEDLSDICDALSPAMAARGLSFRWRTQPGDPVTVACIIAHKDGHREECALSAPRDESGNKNAIQGLGSAITYLQRYTLKAAIGIAASQDDDGHSAGQKAVSTIVDKPVRPQTKPATAETVLPAKADDATRLRAFDILSQEFGKATVLEYFGVAEVSAWPLEQVPTGKRALGELSERIHAWMEKTGKGYPTTPMPQDEPTEAFWDEIITLPRAGTKRADYMQNPDTIRSLYEASKAGDQKAGQRLFGIANEWAPSEWTGNDGKLHPPGQADVNCRAALDQFLAWHEQKGEAQ